MVHVSGWRHLVKPACMSTSQPNTEPKLVTPTWRGVATWVSSATWVKSPLVMRCRGPPESPLQVDRPLTPEMQRIWGLGYPRGRLGGHLIGHHGGVLGGTGQVVYRGDSNLEVRGWILLPPPAAPG